MHFYLGAMHSRVCVCGCVHVCFQTWSLPSLMTHLHRQTYIHHTQMLSPFLSHYANILVLLDILISLFFLEVSNYKATYAKQAIHLHKSVTI